MAESWIGAFLCGMIAGIVLSIIGIGFVFKIHFDRVKREFDETILRQKNAYLSVIRSRDPNDGGSKEKNVFYADFRNKSKKGPNDSGPKNSA